MFPSLPHTPYLVIGERERIIEKSESRSSRHHKKAQTEHTKMCRRHIRLCHVCGWTRTWRWEKCDRYRREQVRCCSEGMPCYPPERCPHVDDKGTTEPWPLVCPATQCGNFDCPERVNEEETLRRIRERARNQLQGQQLSEMLAKDNSRSRWNRSVPKDR